MKYLVSVFVVVAGVLLGCEDSDPDYPIEPFIELKDLMFGETPEFIDLDSIVFSISFQDGDGDLGLEENPEKNPDHQSAPYHYANFFVAENGNLTPVSTYLGVTDEVEPRYFNPVINVDESQTGRLATLSFRDLPEYSDLPPYTFPDRCYHYYSSDVYLLGDDIRIVDDSPFYEVEEIPGFLPPLYKVKGVFYIEMNPNRNNIFVDILIKQPDGTFTIFDWNSASAGSCVANFNTRFPSISDKRGAFKDRPLRITYKSKYKGVITYAMRSMGFKILFQDKTIKLRISITDRALHTSNVIETPEFTLESISQ